jgi:hypothetical protein
VAYQHHHERTVIVRPTALQSGGSMGADKSSEFQALYQCLVEDDTKNSHT